MGSFLAKSLFLLLAAISFRSTFAADVDHTRSYLKATFTQFNVPVTGEFTQFSGQINFDPAKPASTTASLSVVTSSYDLGDEMYNQEVAGKDWFDSKKYPTAGFVLRAVKFNSGVYQVEGQLTLRGVTKLVRFPARIQDKEDAYIFSGQAEIKRLDYGVGQGDWGDTALVEDEVQIDFNLVLPKSQ